jgi:hypothetical protein
MATQDGLRRRYPPSQEQELLDRQELFAGRLNEKTKAKGEQTGLSQSNILEVMREIHRLREENAASLQAIGVGQEAIKTTTEGLMTGQDKLTSMTSRIEAGVKKIGEKTDKILGITQRTETLMRSYNGGNWRELASAVLFDEWLVFYLYFLMHPWMPVTMEAFASVWQLVLPIRRIFLLRADLREGRLISFSVGKTIHNYFTSPWKAIALLYFFNQEFARMRTTDPTQYAALFPGSVDSVFQGLFATVINASVPRLETVTAAAAFTFKEAHTMVTSVFASSPHLWEAVESLCPSWATDKTGFFNCIAAYMAGELGTTVRGVASRFVAVPGLMHQTGMYVGAEKQVLFAVSSFLWSQIIIPLFGNGLQWAKTAAHAFVCSYVGGAWGFGWMGCDAAKFKAEGGGRSKSKSRTRRRDQMSLVLPPLPPYVMAIYLEMQRANFEYVKAVFVQENSPVPIRLPKALVNTSFELYVTCFKLASSPMLMDAHAIELPVLEKGTPSFEKAINSNGSSTARTRSARTRSARTRRARSVKSTSTSKKSTA